jgi:hypothetical protein
VIVVNPRLDDILWVIEERWDAIISALERGPIGPTVIILLAVSPGLVPTAIVALSADRGKLASVNVLAG